MAQYILEKIPPYVCQKWFCVTLRRNDRQSFCCPRLPLVPYPAECCVQSGPSTAVAAAAAASVPLSQPVSEAVPSLLFRR